LSLSPCPSNGRRNARNPCACHFSELVNTFQKGPVPKINMGPPTVVGAAALAYARFSPDALVDDGHDVVDHRNDQEKSKSKFNGVTSADIRVASPFLSIANPLSP
jgi:hypothetical protein